MSGPLLWNPNPPGPSAFILDTSVAMAWLLTGHATTYTDAVLGKLSSTVGVVPATWGTEVANLIRRPERAGTVTRAAIERFYAGLRAFWIRIDDHTNARVWSDTHDLARTYRVSLFTAVYLELALRLKIPVATTDPTLARHATAAGVPIYTP